MTAGVPCRSRHRHMAWPKPRSEPRAISQCTMDGRPDGCASRPSRMKVLQCIFIPSISIPPGAVAPMLLAAGKVTAIFPALANSSSA